MGAEGKLRDGVAGEEVAVEGGDAEALGAAAAGADHAFGEAEFHPAGLEVGDADQLAAHQLLGIGIGLANAGEDVAFTQRPQVEPETQ